MTPASVPSAIANLTSSSVTFTASARGCPTCASISAVERSSSQTNGAPIAATICSGRATRAAIVSGFDQRDALRHQLADDHRQRRDQDDHDAESDRVSPIGRDPGHCRPAPAPSRAPSVAPPNAPDRMPISVMPTCTDDRKRPGFSGKRERPGGARARPSSAICCSRMRRDDTTAISRQREESVEKNEPDEDGELEPDAHSGAKIAVCAPRATGEIANTAFCV